MQIALFDDARRDHLLPLTLTRPVALLRVGITTIAQKWERALGRSCGHLTAEYLRVKYPPPPAPGPCLVVNGGVLPSPALAQAAATLRQGEAIAYQGRLVAALLPQPPDSPQGLTPERFAHCREPQEEPLEVLRPWDLFTLNGPALEQDFAAITQGRRSKPLSSTNRAINPSAIFLEPGARVECAILNASAGPIYIGAHAEVMEGAMVRGPFALGEHSALKMGAKIYGPTTMGPHCKVGGEVNNSVIMGYSNKAHDGFLGHSVIGEWCNLGADTNCSNLKNTYEAVKLWSYPEQRFVDTGRQFCGLIMGDHSKCGINTMFNTGTVVGVSANVFGDGFPRNFIPSFAWGGAQGLAPYRIDRALETARRAMERRGYALCPADEAILRHIHSLER